MLSLLHNASDFSVLPCWSECMMCVYLIVLIWVYDACLFDNVGLSELLVCWYAGILSELLSGRMICTSAKLWNDGVVPAFAVRVCNWWRECAPVSGCAVHVTDDVSVDLFLAVWYVCVTGGLFSGCVVRVCNRWHECGPVSGCAILVCNWWRECGLVSGCACPTDSHKGRLCFTLSVYLCIML